MRHFSNCFLFKFFNFSFICPKKYIQYTRNKYCNMKKWLLKLYLTKKSVFMENSNCFFGSERLIWNPKNIHWCQFYFWHWNTSSVFSVDEIRSSFGAFLKMSTCLRLFLEVQQCQLEPIFGFWGHEVWRIGLQLHSVSRFKHCWTYKK